MRNRYLDEKQRDMDMRRRDMIDRNARMGGGYNPFEPIGQYPESQHRDEHYGHHYPSHSQGHISYENTRMPYDYRYDMRGSDYGYDMRRNDYNDYNDYRRRDYGSNEMEMKYEKDLDMWIEDLKKKDRIGLPKHQVIEQAKQMGVRFENFDEKEFYAVYLMLVSDYKSIGVDAKTFIKMAKEWLEDDDIARKHSEKVCAYLDKIVLGE